jgi:hypothetical protein
MVENGWKLHLDDKLDFVNKSDELLVLMLGDNLKDAMLWLAAYLTVTGVMGAARECSGLRQKEKSPVRAGSSRLRAVATNARC